MGEEVAAANEEANENAMALEKGELGLNQSKKDIVNRNIFDRMYNKISELQVQSS